ncbi:hypothetical protein [Xenorhabdus cabanillasii]|uniref:hypothetical protein n=1 Tax=Xenorhabdus cabanillasii TaxID=351673 RepID=UPI0021003192|nr:hypothetical protein [Xenorhabdus cabanillasii]
MPIRSSFVNYDCPSLLCTVIVSLSRSICLPALRSAIITRFITTMADSDFLIPISQALCFGTCARYTHSLERCQDLLGSALFSTNSPTPETPVCASDWKKITSVPIQKLLPAGSTIPSAQHNQRISALSRSPIGFGSNVSLSTLHLLCYRLRCKTRYVVIWLIFYDGTFTRKKQCSFSQRTVNFAEDGVSQEGIS